MNEFYNDVNDWLSVGGDVDLARALTLNGYEDTVNMLMEDRGVSHVLDLRIEWSDAQLWADAGLPAGNYCHAPVDDRWGYVPEEAWFNSVEQFVHKFLADHRDSKAGRLYVHCHMGINRGPSAAMLALLIDNPDLDPFEAFLAIRRARPAAGLVYAEAVGVRHLSRTIDAGENDGADLALYDALGEFRKAIHTYWTPALRRSVNQGIAFYRDAEGGTAAVANA